MRYFKAIPERSDIDWLLFTDDELSKYHSSNNPNKNHWSYFDKHRLENLQRLWVEITEAEAFLELL